MVYRYFRCALILGMISGCDDSAIDHSATTRSESSLPVVPFGETATGADLAIKIASVSEQSRSGIYGMGPKAGSGNTFVVVRYTMKNTSKEPVSRGDQPTVQLIDADGQSYEPDREAEALESIKNEDEIGPLNPGVTTKQTAVWKVAKVSFSRKTWRLKVPQDETFDATMDKLARWPLNAKAPPSLILALK